MLRALACPWQCAASWALRPPSLPPRPAQQLQASLPFISSAWHDCARAWYVDSGLRRSGESFIAVYRMTYKADVVSSALLIVRGCEPYCMSRSAPLSGPPLLLPQIADVNVVLSAGGNPLRAHGSPVMSPSQSTTVPFPVAGERHR